MSDKVNRQKPVKAIRRDAAEGERLLWTRLRRKQVDGATFRRMYPIHDVVATFACIARKTVVEFDKSTIALPREASHEERRLKRIAALGWTIILVTHDDVFTRLDDAVKQISAAMPPALDAKPILAKPEAPDDALYDAIPDDTGWQP